MTKHFPHLLPYLDLTTHHQEQHITFHQQENKCAKCQICKSRALLPRRIMMTTKSTPVYLMVDMDTCSSGSVPFMGTHMGFISLMVVKEGRIHFHLFSNSRKKCQNTYSMTLHLGYQSIHSTEHHPCFPTQDSSMIYFILWAMYVEITSNLVMLKDLRAWTLRYVSKLTLICSALNTQGPIYRKCALCFSPNSSCTCWTKRRQRSSGKMLM